MKPVLDKAEIRSLWIGDSLSPVERLTATSFIQHGHPFHLYTYHDIASVPSGVQIFDANSIIPEREIFLSHGSYAHFADWFRWKLLKQLGGFWVDMDVVCLRPFAFQEDVIFGYEAGNRPNVSVLRFPAGHPVCIEMEDRCANPNKFRRDDKLRDIVRKLGRRYLHGNLRGSVKWGEAGGPTGFQQVLTQYGLLDRVLPFTYFYPIAWQNAKCIFDATLSRDVSMFLDTHAIHVWNEILRKSGIDKRGPFPKDSLFRQLLEQYGL